MTNGQIALIEELDKCHLMYPDDKFHFEFFLHSSRKWRLDKDDKATLRRLTHQYRHQIKAMKRNRK